MPLNSVEKPDPATPGDLSATCSGQARFVPRSEVVYLSLREAILNGKLPPGERMREVALAAQYGVSRTPVREALGRLETEGLLTLELERGLIVTEMSLAMVSELYVMREVLEGTAAALAARHASPVELATLRTLVDRDQSLIKDAGQLAKHNLVFHLALYRSAHNRYLLKMLSSLQESIALLGPTGLASGQRAREATSEHQRLVSALEAHDARGAEEIARAHIRGAMTARLSVLRQAASGRKIDD